jgi:hypothetical protein
MNVCTYAAKVRGEIVLVDVCKEDWDFLLSSPVLNVAMAMTKLANEGIFLCH